MFEQLMEHVLILIIAIIFGGITSLLAWRFGLFTTTKALENLPESPAFFDIARTFILFMAMEILVPTFVAFVFLSIEQRQIFSGNLLDYLSTQAYGWLNLISMSASAVGVALGFSYIQPAKRRVIWGDPRDITKNLCLGMASWFVSYPVVMAVGQLVWLGLFYFGLESHLDQVAVRHLKQVLPYPIAFTLTVAAIVVLVPVVEEILFRGLLQTWLSAKWGIKRGIVITSLIFALFHFSFSQGLVNIELIISLFLLSCFLGFLYAKQRSLWASIGLHSAFNAASIFMIIFVSV